MQWFFWYWLNKRMRTKLLSLLFYIFSINWCCIADHFQLMRMLCLPPSLSLVPQRMGAADCSSMSKISAAPIPEGFLEELAYNLIGCSGSYQPTPCFTQAFRSSDIAEGIQCVARMSWVAAFAVFVSRTTTCQIIQGLFTKCITFHNN
jgi:hypothetical protein